MKAISTQWRALTGADRQALYDQAEAERKRLRSAFTAEVPPMFLTFRCLHVYPKRRTWSDAF